MPLGRKAATKPSSRRPPIEFPLTEYERERMETMMLNSRVFRSLGLEETTNILKNSRAKATGATHEATREDSGSLYQPEDGEDVEQGVVDKEAMQHLEPEVASASGARRKRVMALALQGQDQPSRITRQRTRLARQDTTDSQDGFTEDGLIAANDITQTNNQNELSTEGQCIKKKHISRHVGRDLDNISRGLPNKIPVHISEGKLRPEVPLQAAKLASEAGIILRNHVPVFTHWKHYKEKDAIGVVKDFNDKVSKQTKYKDAPPTAIDIFKDTHCSSKSGFSENAKDAIAEMEAYVAQPTEEGKDPKTPVEAVAHVLPKSTFLRNVGLQSTEMKRNAKSAAMNDRVRDLESELEAEKMGSAGLQAQVDDLQKQLEEQKEAARKNEEQTEKLRQQGSEIQGFLRSLFGNRFASGDA
ncbi:unnamed protein product [Urochloa humidicola]